MSSTSTGSTRHAVLTAVFDRIAAAWAAADGSAFGAEFADDADFVEIRGGHHHGRAAIAGGHQALFDGIYAGSRVTYRVETVRDLAPGLAVGIVGATLEAPAGPLAGTSHARITAVVAEQADGWRVLSFHNTLVQGAPT